MHDLHYYFVDMNRLNLSWGWDVIAIFVNLNLIDL